MSSAISFIVTSCAESKPIQFHICDHSVIIVLDYRVAVAYNIHLYSAVSFYSLYNIAFKMSYNCYIYWVWYLAPQITHLFIKFFNSFKQHLTSFFVGHILFF